MCIIGLLNAGLFVLLLEEILNKRVTKVWCVLGCILIWQCIRRCHDVGRPWYYCCIPGYIFVLLFKDGEEDENKWGLSSKYEYVPEDFASLDLYYGWRDKKPVFRKNWFVQTLQCLCLTGILVGCLLFKNTLDDFIVYEQTSNYYDFEGSKTIRFYIPEGVEVDPASVKDILILKTENGKLYVYEDKSDVTCCGLELKHRTEGDFDIKIYQDLVETAEDTGNVFFSKFEFINKFLQYFKR